MVRSKPLASCVLALVLVSGASAETTEGAAKPRVTICHHAGPDKVFEIEVSVRAVPAHVILHGDNVGPCVPVEPL